MPGSKTRDGEREHNSDEGRRVPASHEASIAAFDEGHYDVAIALAGAAEGMAPETGTALFPYLRDHPGIAAEGVGKTEWVSALNVERDWLKHHAPNHLATMEFERASAAIMLVRAISKAQAAFKFQSEATKEFRRWINENVETLFSDDDAQPRKKPRRSGACAVNAVS